MRPSLAAFTEEIIKLSTPTEVDVDLAKAYREAKRPGPPIDETMAALRGSGRRVSRDYLASMFIGAGIAPLASLAGRRVSRGLHNREVMQALTKATSGKQRKLLAKEIMHGKLLGQTQHGMSKSVQPTMSKSELGGQAARGALMGSLVQMLRDRFAGSAGMGDR